MVAALFIIFWLFRLTGIEKTLSDREQTIYLWTIFVYPLLEGAVLWIRIKGFMPIDFDWVNRLEHFCWAIALTFFFLPLISRIWKRLCRWQNLLFVVGFVCLLGNLNEFLEFIVRIQKAPIDPVVFANFYTDTILDMTMNLCGSIVSFLLLSKVFAKSSTGLTPTKA
jgi:hypothetical protein